MTPFSLNPDSVPHMTHILGGAADTSGINAHLVTQILEELRVSLTHSLILTGSAVRIKGMRKSAREKASERCLSLLWKARK